MSKKKVHECEDLRDIFRDLHRPDYKFRKSISPSNGDKQLLFRPQSLKEYAWIIECERSHFRTPNNFSIDRLFGNTIEGIDLAVNLILDFRTEQKSIWSTFLEDEELPERVFWEAKHPWILLLLHMYAIIQENGHSSLLEFAIDGYCREKFYDENGWPINTDSELLTEVGWSALEVANRFMVELLEIFLDSFSYVNREIIGDTNYVPTPVVMGDKPSQGFWDWQDLIKRRLEAEFSPVGLPAAALQKEQAKIISKMEYEYLQYQSRKPSKRISEETVGPLAVDLAELARQVRDADYLIRTEGTQEETALYGYSEAAVKAVHKAMYSEQKLHSEIENRTGAECASELRKDLSIALKFDLFSDLQEGTNRTQYREENIGPWRLENKEGEKIAKQIELIVVPTAAELVKRTRELAKKIDSIQTFSPKKMQEHMKEGFQSVPQIIRYFQIPKNKQEAVKKRLSRFRQETFDPDAWIEVQDRGRNKPRFLYSVAKIEPILKDLCVP